MTHDDLPEASNDNVWRSVEPDPLDILFVAGEPTPYLELSPQPTRCQMIGDGYKRCVNSTRLLVHMYADDRDIVRLGGNKDLVVVAQVAICLPCQERYHLIAQDRLVKLGVQLAVEAIVNEGFNRTDGNIEKGDAMGITVKHFEGEMQLTPRFEAALIETMKAWCEMMQGTEELKDGDATDWWWGRATIKNTEMIDGIDYEFGPESDMPDDGLGRFGIVVRQ